MQAARPPGLSRPTAGDWKPDREKCSARQPIFRGNLSLMRLDNGTANRKSYAHALRFRREKRVENVLEIPDRHAGTGIANPDFRAGTGKVGGYADFAHLYLGLGYRVHRIDNQIQNHLL